MLKIKVGESEQAGLPERMKPCLAFQCRHSAVFPSDTSLEEGNPDTQLLSFLLSS